MSKWKATLPKERPAPGQVNICFAYMDANGARIEINGPLRRKGVDAVIAALGKFAVRPPAEGGAR